MIYTGKCPRCGAIVRSGSGSPWKRIDTPLRKCPRCFRSYIDENMYEWSVIGPAYKLWYYFFANNRIFPWFLLAIVAYRNWIYALTGCAVWTVICVLWVQITSKERIKASKQRTSRQEYVDLLAVIGYDKLSAKHYRKCDGSIDSLWLDLFELGKLGVFGIIVFLLVAIVLFLVSIQAVIAQGTALLLPMILLWGSLITAVVLFVKKK